MIAFALPRRLTLPGFVLLGLVAAGCGERAPRPSVLESTTARAVAEGGDDPTVVAPDAVSTPALGAAEPRVVVTLFTDYQCPNCKRMHDLAARLVDRWPDAVQVQFRQLPLTQHPLARTAARAALAAHRQGRFACMHSALGRSRPSWTGLSLAAFQAFLDTTLAPHCGLDVARFARDREDPAIAAKVQADWELAGALGVRGTPTVLVDGLEAKLWPRAGTRPALLLNAVVRRGLRDVEAQLAACERDGTIDCGWRHLVARRLYGNTGSPDAMKLLD